jgi:4-amino-4-deoxy-L-arabinose transferase-like glycosyltransferase
LLSTIFNFQRSPEQRRLVISLILLVIFAAALRLYGLDRWSLWLDETITYLYVSRPLGELYAVMDATHMPVSLELSHALVQLGFDQSVWQLRLPSAILGVATVVVVFFLANELFCQRVGLFSALVACVMPVLVVYSQEYRPYSLLIFLTAFSGWSLATALRTNSAGWWCVFVSSTILNLYTHFVALSSVAALMVAALACILLKVRQREPVKPTIVSAVMAFGIIAVAYVPALPRLARLMETNTVKFGGARPGWDVFRLIFIQYPGFGGWLSYVAVGLAIVGLIWAGFRSPRGLLFLAAVLFVSAFLFRDQSHVVFSPRYVSFVMPYFAVAIGAGVAAMTSATESFSVHLWPDARHVGIRTAAVLVVLLVLASVRPLSMVYAANPKQLPVDLREGFNYVHKRIHPNDLLLEASTTKGGSVYWFSAYNSYFLRKSIWPTSPVQGLIDNPNFPNQLTRYLDVRGRLFVLITVGDGERTLLEERAGPDFAVQCYRRICAIQSRHPRRPMLEQLNAFFDRFAVLDPKYFAASARAVRAEVK